MVGPKREAAFFGDRKVSVADDATSRIAGKYVPARSKVLFYSQDHQKSKISIKEQRKNNNGQVITTIVAKQYHNCAEWMRNQVQSLAEENQQATNTAERDLPWLMRRAPLSLMVAAREQRLTIEQVLERSPEMANKYRKCVSDADYSQAQRRMIRESSIQEAEQEQRDTVGQTSLSMAEAEAPEQLTELVAKANKGMCMCACMCICTYNNNKNIKSIISFSINLSTINQSTNYPISQ
jgi:hypothetical protein